MNNKKGFISMSLVYSFLVIFLFLMLAIIDCYGKKNTYLEALDDKVAQDIGITKETKTSIFKQILKDNVALEIGTINFKKISNTSNKNGNGLFYIEDNGEQLRTDENLDGYGTKIYFFRGSVDNNYVVFGNQLTRNSSNEITAVKKMCWRIMRTNENGSIRLIYSGLQNADNGECPSSNTYIDSSAFNTLSIDNAYVGYTYGNEVTSTVSTPNDEQISDYINQTHYYYENDGIPTVTTSKIKTLLDNFFYYNTNLYESTELEYEYSGKTELADSRMSDAIYCNDRSTYSKDSYGIIQNTKLSYSKNNTIYASYAQFEGKPTFACSTLSRDRYTLAEMYGGTNANNNALSYAIGLPSVADAVFAGGAYQTNNNNYYLYSNYDYWTMSPAYYNDNVAKVFKISGSGSITEETVTTSLKVRPVISIKESTLVINGSGLINDPYILE